MTLIKVASLIGLGWQAWPFFLEERPLVDFRDLLLLLLPGFLRQSLTNLGIGIHHSMPCFCTAVLLQEKPWRFQCLDAINNSHYHRGLLPGVISHHFVVEFVPRMPRIEPDEVQQE